MKTPAVLKSAEQVLAELAEKHPELLPHVEQDRSWLWLVGDFRGEQHKALRESIGRRGVGFIFAAAGHALPSGRTSNWGHHLETPTRFKRRGKTSSTTTNASEPAFSDAELLAAIT